MDASSNPQGRPGQLSLFSFLILCTLAAPLAANWYRAGHVLLIEWTAANRMRSAGVQVESDYYDRYGLHPPSADNMPAQLAEQLFSRPIAVNGEISLSAPSNRGDVLTSAALMPHLRRIKIWGDGINHGAVRRLAGLPKINHASISSSEFPDPWLTDLGSMRRLQRLEISSDGITDASVVYLARMTHLKELTIFSTRLSEAGYRRLEEALPGTKVFPRRFEREDLMLTQQLIKSQELAAK